MDRDFGRREDFCALSFGPNLGMDLGLVFLFLFAAHSLEQPVGKQSVCAHVEHNLLWLPERRRVMLSPPGLVTPQECPGQDEEPKTRVPPQHEEKLLPMEGGRALEQLPREGVESPFSGDIPNPPGWVPVSS
ncbi:hypothetical protein HGM15179_014326 [Zosterops borbonicus]|uniref:Uncharacterized protein n=1 Tax=Zosterops borbonicus TaxID=364589 RepID=A0A8K1LG62_9PASS|nr:hypothetical protein HGM15179_014326 [Zosterops borbonicus]